MFLISASLCLPLGLLALSGPTLPCARPVDVNLLNPAADMDVAARVRAIITLLLINAWSGASAVLGATSSLLYIIIN
jgi:hypothetical protein